MTFRLELQGYFVQKPPEASSGVIHYFCVSSKKTNKQGDREQSVLLETDKL